MKNWKMKKSLLPHQPYNIVDETDDLICVVFSNLDELENAKLISLSPKYRALCLKFISMIDSDAISSVSLNSLYSQIEDLEKEYKSE